MVGDVVDTLERLQKILRQKGWSMYRLTKESGLSESTIANIYRRNALPSIPTLETICEGFGITLSAFFADSEMVALNPEQKEVYDYWLFMTQEQKQVILATMRAFLNDRPEHNMIHKNESQGTDDCP